jgi:hypothetical protein
LRVLLPLTDEDEYVSVMSGYVLTWWDGYYIFISGGRDLSTSLHVRTTQHRLFPITAQLTNIHLFKG